MGFLIVRPSLAHSSCAAHGMKWIGHLTQPHWSLTMCAIKGIGWARPLRSIWLHERMDAYRMYGKPVVHGIFHACGRTYKSPSILILGGKIYC